MAWETSSRTVDAVSDKEIALSAVTTKNALRRGARSPQRRGRATTNCATMRAARDSGLSAFLEELGAIAFTDTFEDLHGLRQLPGMATQRLMAAGYGFGGEGDWKTVCSRAGR